MGITHIYLAITMLAIGLLVLLAMEGLITFPAAFLIGLTLFIIRILKEWCEETGENLVTNIKNMFSKK